MIVAPNFADLEGLAHGFGERSSQYPEGVRTAKQIHIVMRRRSSTTKLGQRLCFQPFAFWFA